MKYNAFISYSHAADGSLAPALKRGLHRFACPWNKLRALNVFVDDANLSLNPGLWSSIKKALDESEHLILLASPQAATREWVRMEIQVWTERHSGKKPLIVLTAGEIAWDNTSGDFDWQKTNCLPPNVGKLFSEEPRFLDLRNCRSDTDLSLHNPAFRDKIAELAASLHNRSKDEMIGDDIRILHRNKLIARWAIGLLLGLASLAVGAAFYAFSEAKIAEGRLAKSYWDESQRIGDNDRVKSLHLAFEAIANTADDVAKRNILFDVGLMSPVPSLIQTYSIMIPRNSPKDIRGGISPDDRLVVLVTRDTTYLFGAASGNLLSQFAGDCQDMRFAPNGDPVGVYGSSLLRVVDLRTCQTTDSLDHQDEVLSADFVADSRHVLSYCAGGSRFLWQLGGIARSIALIGETGTKGGLTINADQTKIVAWDDERNYQLVSVTSMRTKIWHLKTKTNLMYAAFSAQSDRLVLGSPQGWIQVVNADDGSTVWGPRHCLRGMNGIIASPKGKIAALWTGNGKCQLWDVDSGRAVADFAHDRSRPVFSPDGQYLLARFNDTLTVRDPQNGNLIRSVALGREAGEISDFGRGATRVLVEGEFFTSTHVIDLQNGIDLGAPTKEGAPALQCQFAPSGSTLLGTHYDGTTQLYRPDDLKPIGCAMTPQRGGMKAVFNFDGTKVLAIGMTGGGLWRLEPEVRTEALDISFCTGILNRDGTRILKKDKDGRLLGIWDTQNAKLIESSLTQRKDIIAFVPSRDGESLLAWQADGLVQRWRIADGKTMGDPIRETNPTTGVILDATHLYALALHQDSTASLWDLSLGQLIHQYLHLHFQVQTIAVAANGKQVLTTQADGVYDLVTGDSVAQIEDTRPRDRDVFCTQGSRLLTAKEDTLFLRDLRTGRMIGSRALVGGRVMEERIRGALFFSDASRIMTWGENSVLCLWDADLHEQTCPTIYHLGIEGALLSPDQLRIVTWGRDSTVRFWDARTGRALGKPLRHSDEVIGVSFAYDGTRALVCGNHHVSLVVVENDPDIPPTLALLQVTTLTGTTYDAASGTVVPLSIEKWKEINSEYQGEAQNHLRVCASPKLNLWHRLFPDVVPGTNGPRSP
jgi:WD40 repeat protein